MGQGWAGCGIGVEETGSRWGAWVEGGGGGTCDCFCGVWVGVWVAVRVGVWKGVMVGVSGRGSGWDGMGRHG